MLTRRIIACLDVRDGRVVKGVQFLDLIDAGDPAALAHRHAQEGADEIVLLDITATHEGRATLLDTVRRTAQQLFVPFTVGGGIRTAEDAAQVFEAGADKVSINTAAVLNPQLVADASSRFGSQCIVVAIDAKRVGDHWQVFTHGGRKATGLDAVEWACKMVKLGAGELLLTSMDRDGTRTGFDLALTRTFSDAVEVPIIASGGVGNLDHLVDGVVQGGADAVLAASIFHYGEYTVLQAKQRMQQDKIEVRL